MALKRMDNVGIVVESLDTAISFFAELGMKLEGRTTIEMIAAVFESHRQNARVELPLKNRKNPLTLL